VFPLRDDNPTLQISTATIAVIAANALVWVFIQGLGFEPALSSSVCSYGLIPGELLGLAPPGTRVPLGPEAACVLGAPAWHTPLTSMFMHGGWFHIVGNMWFLWVFGDNVEDSMGHARFLLFYVLCGLAAAAAQTLSHPASPIPMVGASGAIGGVMGAYFLLYPHVRVHTLLFLGFYATTIEVPASMMLGYWFLLQILSGLPALGQETGGVAFWAHAGGFLAGLVLVKVFRDPRRMALRRQLTGRSSL
jgi:membrane associated rhomboid family serine protease